MQKSKAERSPLFREDRDTVMWVFFLFFSCATIAIIFFISMDDKICHIQMDILESVKIRASLSTLSVPIALKEDLVKVSF